MDGCQMVTDGTDGAVRVALARTVGTNGRWRWMDGDGRMDDGPEWTVWMARAANAVQAGRQAAAAAWTAQAGCWCWCRRADGAAVCGAVVLVSVRDRMRRMTMNDADGWMTDGAGTDG